MVQLTINFLKYAPPSALELPAWLIIIYYVNLGRLSFTAHLKSWPEKYFVHFCKNVNTIDKINHFKGGFTLIILLERKLS